ncbi:MAG: Ig-like domain-containing protein, partial [Gemmatimonadaceae bacterium]|nr:Ig-like domain-containing protein [Gemmatimonadaceae bacterium]
MRIRLSSVAVVSAALLFGCQEAPTRATSPDDQELSVNAERAAAAAAKVKSVSVSPSSASVAVGQTVQLTAKTKPVTAATFVWASSNQSVATVSQSGLVTGVSAGSATVTATTSGKTGSSTITVTETPPPPP